MEGFKIYKFFYSYKEDGNLKESTIIQPFPGGTDEETARSTIATYLMQFNGIELVAISCVGQLNSKKIDVSNEKKTKRGNLLFTPTVYEGMQILAEMHKTSLNDLLHEISKQYISERYEQIEFYKERQEEIDKVINKFKF